MTTFDLIYPAIGAFSLLVIGLVLTILEFSAIQKKKEAKKNRKLDAK